MVLRSFCFENTTNFPVIWGQWNPIYYSIIKLLVIQLSLFRYTKPKGQLPDYESPVVLKNGQSTVEDFCNSLHKAIMKEFKQ